MGSLGPQIKQKDVQPRMERRQSLGLLVQVEPNFSSSGQGPEKTSTFMNTGRRSGLLLETGHTAFRTSIQWSRIFQKDEEINQAGVDFTAVSLKRLKKRIHLLVNLYHFDLPMALQEQGDGWENKETFYAYQEYARFVSRLWRSDGRSWITFNEPIVHGVWLFYDAHFSLGRRSSSS